MGTKMGPGYANLFVGYIEHRQFFNQYNGPKLELYRHYIDNFVGATSSTGEELDQFITAVNSFRPALKYTEISDTFLAFLDTKSIYFRIHHMSRIPFLILSFLNFVAFVWSTLIFP